MNKRYIFCDTDATGNAKYDIAGDAYRTLLKTCFRYCESVSFLVNPLDEEKAELLQRMEDHRLPLTEETRHAHPGKMGIAKETGTVWFELRHYRLTPQTQVALEQITDSIFKWIYGWGNHNPEDPAFHRADGSTFFSSSIHDGICVLSPKETEDITALLLCGNWQEE